MTMTRSHARGGHEVGSLLRALRESAGLTQDALARAASCSKAYLSLVESGRRSLSIDKAQAIEAALEIHDGRLQAALNWQRVPAVIRAQVEIEHVPRMKGEIMEALLGQREHVGIEVKPFVGIGIPQVGGVCGGAAGNFEQATSSRQRRPGIR